MSGRPKSTVYSRSEEFKSDGMYVFDKQKKIMMCKACNCRVAWDRRSTVLNHIKSSQHKDSKTKWEKTQNQSKKRQQSVSDSFEGAKKAKEDREEFIKSTVNAFLKANIPLHKFNQPEIRKWFKKYVPGGSDLPSAKWLRQHYVPLLKKDYDSSLIEKLKGKKVAVLCDETTNRRGEAAFVTLFKILPSEENSEPELFVASVKILDAVTGDATSRAIFRTLADFEVDHSNVIAVVSDSAAYMNLCARLLQELGLSNMVHVQCWAHKLDKGVKVFSDKLVRLNECVSKTKKLFKNTRKRKHKYQKFLENKYSFSKAKEVKLFPLPVMSRWGSWKTSAIYLSEYVEDVTEYVKTIPESMSVKSVDYFKKLSKDDIEIIKTEALFVAEYCTPISGLLLEVESSKVPLSHVLYSKVNEVRKVFKIVKRAADIKTVLYAKTKENLNKISSASKKKSLEERFRSVSTKCDGVLSEFLFTDTGKSFFEASQTLFDPCKLVLSSPSDAKLETARKNAVMLSSIPPENFKVLHGLLSDNIKEAFRSRARGVKDYEITVNALMAMKVNHPVFVVQCLQVLHVPVANVDSERAFSAYGDIVSARRTRLKPQNAEVMLCLYFGDDLTDDDQEADGCDERNATGSFMSVNDHGLDYFMDPDDPEEIL